MEIDNTEAIKEDNIEVKLRDEERQKEHVKADRPTTTVVDPLDRNSTAPVVPMGQPQHGVAIGSSSTPMEPTHARLSHLESWLRDVFSLIQRLGKDNCNLSTQLAEHPSASLN